MIVEGQLGEAVVSYLMVFFAIWWAWMNFSWFASAFDTDDWLYRVTTIVQMAGVLVLAAGVHDAMVDQDFTHGDVGVRSHASRHGDAVAASRGIRSDLARLHAARRRRDHGRSGAVGGEAVSAG